MPDKRSAAFKESKRSVKHIQGSTRAGKAGIKMADSICAMVDLFYQHKTAHNFLNALIKRLQERKPEFKAVKE